MGRRTNQVTHKWLGTKFKFFYLRVEGRTKSPTVFWSKFKVLLPTSERTSQATNNCLDTKFKSFYLWVEGRTKSLTSTSVQNLSPSTYGWKDEPSHLQVPWLKFKVLLPTGERTNQATNKCLSTKFKSFYQWVEGRTKSPTSALVEV